MHTIRIADADVIGYASGVTPIFYGTAELRGIAPGTDMAIRYHAGRGTATIHPWPGAKPTEDYSVRILHGDVLAIGAHQFRVHCPPGSRPLLPELQLITTD